jgi:hypothetical protein
LNDFHGNFEGTQSIEKELNRSVWIEGIQSSISQEKGIVDTQNVGNKTSTEIPGKKDTSLLIYSPTNVASCRPVSYLARWLEFRTKIGRESFISAMDLLIL